MKATRALQNGDFFSVEFNFMNFYLPNTIQITMQFPIIAIKSINPNKSVQSAFCSHGISYGRLGDGLKHSVMKSLQMEK